MAMRPLERAHDREALAGRGMLVARAGAAGTVLAKAEATAPLRFVRPTFPGSRAAAVCLVTFGGGLVDGDAIALELVVEPGATLVVFTQSTTKAFRGTTEQSIRAEVHGTLVLLPDPVACFAGARYRQRVDVTLHGEGSAVVLDGLTSGRAAFGERWDMSRVDLATTVRAGSRAGATTSDGATTDDDAARVLVRDALFLDQQDAPIGPRLGRFEALATLLALGPRVAPVVRSLLAPPVTTDDLVAAPSALARADGAIARIAASSPARALAEARRRLGNLPDIDVVDPFASRH